MIINGQKKAYKIDDKLFHCGIDVAMGLIGGKWKCVILYYLRNGTLRFSEIKELIPDITEKMLTMQLKSLQTDQLVLRQEFGHKPPLRVEYSLTPLGNSLLPLITLIEDTGKKWGQRNGAIVDV